MTPNRNGGILHIVGDLWGHCICWGIELDLNFIPENELKEYCKEQDTGVEAVLFEYLLKE